MENIRKSSSTWSVVRSFHEDEDGVEALQAIIIGAIGAILLTFFLKTFWPIIRDWAKTQLDTMTTTTAE